MLPFHIPIIEWYYILKIEIPYHTTLSHLQNQTCIYMQACINTMDLITIGPINSFENPNQIQNKNLDQSSLDSVWMNKRNMLFNFKQSLLFQCECALPS